MEHKFPHKVVVEGHYGFAGVLDQYEEILFNEFGYYHGYCRLDESFWYYGKIGKKQYNTEYNNDLWFSYYPRCADIDVEALEDWHKIVKENNWKHREEDLIIQELAGVEFIREHSHIGVWRYGLFGKTNYDYGQQIIEFKYKKDLVIFILKFLKSQDLVKEERYSQPIKFKLEKEKEDVNTKL